MKRHPLPWSLAEHPESYMIRDASGNAVRHIYFEDEPLRRSVTGRRTKAQARAFADSILALVSGKSLT